MNGDAAQYGYWGNDSRVEEVDTGEDEDSNSGEIGLPARRSRHYAGGSLSASATDLGDQAGSIVQRRLPYQVMDDEDEEDLGSTEDDDDDDFTPDMEEALVQSALMRISRAQAKGRTDVRLNQDELAALERRRQRIEEEERRQRKKRKEQRVAVPLSQFESLTRKTRISRQNSGDEPPEPPAHQVVPPIGYFPPPAGSRSQTQTDAWPVVPNHDPFQYQTEGPRAPHPAEATISGPRRHGSSGSGGSASSDLSYRPSRSSGSGSIASWSQQGSRKGSPGTSEVDNEETAETGTTKPLRRGVQTRASAKSVEHVAVDLESAATAAETTLSRQSSKRATSPRRKSVGAGTATTTNARGGATVRGAIRGRGGASVRGAAVKKK